MLFGINSKVRIKDNAFPGSDDRKDVEARGKVGRVVGRDTTYDHDEVDEDSEPIAVNLYYVEVGDDLICPIPEELEPV